VILIVDDNLQNLRILGKMLKGNGHNVALASSGSEALEFVQRKIPDLILLDIMMPEMDGIEACYKLKQEETTKQIPVIFITAQTDISEKLKAFKAGGEDYITKPFAKEEVLTRVNLVLDREFMKKKLKEAMNETEKINRELQDFAYIVSHDLKAPLRGINTVANWLLDDYSDDFDDEGKEHLNTLVNRSIQMANLIDGILDYSRIGRTEQDIALIDIKNTISESIDILNIPENISVTYPKNLPAIIFEPTRLEEIFINLISNSVKYMDKAKGQIIIDYKDSGNCHLFSVSDNGPGIEKEYYDQIFEIFQTLSSHDSVKSSGVGLTITKKIIEHYGGKIWLESEVELGTVFYFTILKEINI